MEALTYFLENMDRRIQQPKYPHKKKSDNFDLDEYNGHKFMLEEMINCEEIISQRLVKYPVEFVINLRVEEFHQKMVAFLSNLLVKLGNMQEYHIDLRNWHSTLSMGALKKILDSKVISNKQEFSQLRNSFITANKQARENGEEVGLKTIFTM